VKGTRDEFLARARLAENEDRRAGGGDGLNLLQDAAEGGGAVGLLARPALRSILIPQGKGRATRVEKRLEAW
jgi:hypothetical protein